MQHYHVSPFFGTPTTPSATLIPAGITCMSEQIGKTLQALASARYNLVNYKFSYIEPSGPRYINSKFNNVN